MATEALCVLALAATLVWAVWRPRELPEAVVGVPAAAAVLALGALPLEHAGEELRQLGPVLGFLAAVLVLAKLCDDEGLFRYCGNWLAHIASGPHRLLAGVFLVAALITAVLSLDATVVLLTPVVLATTNRLGVSARPHLYACAHLANTASLLLPVSNLTNLLAFTAAGLNFTRFAGLMALPWSVAIAVEYLIFRKFFARDLTQMPRPDTDEAAKPPLFVLFTVAATLTGFVATSVVGLNPAWAALVGAVILAVRASTQRRTTPMAILKSAEPMFLAFVAALAVVVRAVTDNGLGAALASVVPDGADLFTLLALAALAALLSNVINNLPAVLVLLPLATGSGPGAVLAVLLGVNLGPNLTYPGSLATLLWRRIIRSHGEPVALCEFTRLGLLTVPTTLIAAVSALWLSLQVFGA